MYRQSLIKAARPALRLQPSAIRTFTSTQRIMAEGDLGAPKIGGDAFSKREKANEDYTVRQREKEKLLALKQKLAEQQQHLKKLEEHIDEVSRQSGGEQN